MKDLIDRQAAIDYCYQLINVEHQQGSDEMNYGQERVAQTETILHHLEFMPSAQPEQRWILCSERLPEVSGRYLVTRGINACGAMWNRVYIINYSDLMGLKPERIWWDGNVGKSDFERIDNVIAWMFLPKPYKEEGHDEVDD